MVYVDDSGDVSGTGAGSGDDGADSVGDFENEVRDQESDRQDDDDDFGSGGWETDDDDDRDTGSSGATREERNILAGGDDETSDGSGGGDGGTDGSSGDDGTGSTGATREERNILAGGDGNDREQDPQGPRKDLTEQDVPTRVDDISNLRFATEETTIAGTTYREGEALPPEEQVARDLETDVVTSDPLLGRGDVEVTRDDGRFETGLTESGVDRLSRVDPEDLVYENEARTEIRDPQTQAGARQQAIAGAVLDLETDLGGRVGRAGDSLRRADINVERGRDVVVRDTPGGGFRLQPTEQFQREILGEITRRQLSMEDFQAGEDFVVEETGEGMGVELTPEGRQQVTEQRIESQMAARGGEAVTVEGETVSDTDQLQFDEEGELVGAEPEMTREEEIEVIEETVRQGEAGTVTGDVTGLVGRGLGETRATLFGVGETAADAGSFVVEEGVEPIAGGVGSVAGGLADLSPIWTEEQAAALEEGTETAVGGVGEGAVRAVSGAPLGIAQAADLTGSSAAFAAEEVDARGIAGGALASSAAAQSFVGRSARAAGEAFADQPLRTTAMAAGGVAGPLAGGRALGVAGRAARRRARTAGGTEVDVRDITQPEVLRNVETGGSEGRRFPRALDEALYRDDPPEAVRQQASEMTPEEVSRAFEQAGVTEGADLLKALEVEPEGPRSGRAGQGLRTQEGDYESPGGFVGPELSPNFLGLESRSAEFSLRPGLPDFGESPTGALIRTDVDAPDAGDLDEFTEEILSREGETTARTKPAGEVNVGEIEAVIPPEAEFAPLPRGPVSSVARRLGIGADFYTELPGGTRVPLRPVADPDEINGSPSRSLRDLARDERAQAGASGGGTRMTYSVDELYQPARAGTDRPLPASPAAATASSDFVDGTADYEADVLSESEVDATNTRSSSAVDSDTTSVGGGTSVSETGGTGSASTSGTPSSTRGGSSGVSQPGGGSQPSGVGSPGQPARPSQPPRGPPTSSLTSTAGPPSTTTSRPPSQPPRLRAPDPDEEEDELLRVEAATPFTREFGYGIEDPTTIVSGDLDALGEPGGDYRGPTEVGEPQVTEVTSVGDVDVDAALDAAIDEEAALQDSDPT